jgi:hypothetical protein
MDDITCIVSTHHRHLPFHKTIHNYIQNDIYDQDHKKLIIIPQTDLNFLDATIIISQDNTDISIIYNNKNKNCILTHEQTIGRFHHATTPSHISHKLSAAQTIFVKIFDFTSYPLDMLLPAATLTYELRLLDYSHHTILSAIIKSSRSRPSPIWQIIHKIISSTSL